MKQRLVPDECKSQASKWSRSSRVTRCRCSIFWLLLATLVTGCTINLGGGGSEADLSSRPEGLSNNGGPSAGETTEQKGTATGQTYLDIVNEVNCLVESMLTLERQNSLGDGSFNPAILPDAQLLLAKLADAREVAVRNLLNETWPVEVDAEIDLIARDWSKVARTELLLADAPDLGTYNQLADGYRSFTWEGNPGYVRSQLGVGPASQTNDC